MDIQEKEIEVIEASLPKLQAKNSKRDSTSSSLFFLTVILHVISTPGATIKLAILGVEMKVEYAVYILFLISLFIALSFIINKIHENVLIQRYTWLINERFGSIPPGVMLSFFSEHDVKKNIFQNSLKKVSNTINTVMLTAFILGYLWMTYELLSLALLSPFNSIMSILIIIVGIYLIISFIQLVFLKVQNKEKSISFNRE